MKILPKRARYSPINRGFSKASINMCGKKSRFKSSRHARIFLQERNINTMHPYDCPFCGRVHIGHSQER